MTEAPKWSMAGPKILDPAQLDRIRRYPEEVGRIAVSAGTVAMRVPPLLWHSEAMICSMNFQELRRNAVMLSMFCHFQTMGKFEALREKFQVRMAISSVE